MSRNKRKAEARRALPVLVRLRHDDPSVLGLTGGLGVVKRGRKVRGDHPVVAEGTAWCTACRRMLRSSSSHRTRGCAMACPATAASAMLSRCGAGERGIRSTSPATTRLTESARDGVLASSAGGSSPPASAARPRRVAVSSDENGNASSGGAPQGRRPRHRLWSVLASVSASMSRGGRRDGYVANAPHSWTSLRDGCTSECASEDRSRAGDVRPDVSAL
jgi:hypothetical protein